MNRGPELCTLIFFLVWFDTDQLLISFSFTPLALLRFAIFPMSVKEPWRIWVNKSHESRAANNITTAKQSTMEFCAYYNGIYCIMHSATHRPHTYSLLLSVIRIAVVIPLLLTSIHYLRETLSGEWLTFTMQMRSSSVLSLPIAFKRHEREI